MITWKRRLPSTEQDLIHTEEEVEISIKPEEYDNLIFLLKNVLHLNLVESYERYRSVYSNDEVEVVIDDYPFGIALEIEDKTHTDKAKEIINYWLEKLNLNIKDAYQLSWDDKYSELCKSQGKEVYNIVTFDKDMPSVTNEF